MKTAIGVLVCLLILSLYVEVNEVREPIRFRDTWACGGKETREFGDEDTERKIPPPELKPQVWCQRETASVDTTELEVT